MATALTRLPQVALATLAVAVLPVTVVWALRWFDIVHGFLPLMALGTALSLALSMAGAAYWKRRSDAGDYLFRELMIWGWLRRLYTERRLDNAVNLLDRSDGDFLTLERRQKLLEQLATALEYRDPYTHGHSRRVARHSATIAKRMGLRREEMDRIRTAAAIHDIGKVEIPTEVLHKAGGLTDEEFAVIKEHPVEGARMTRALDDPELTRIVRHHHERLDGGGYPDGLAGSDVPIGARIIAVADTFDAITSTRPYREARNHRQALAVLKKEAGTQLDPGAVRAFCSYYSGFRPVALWMLFTSGPQRAVASLLRNVDAGSVAAAKMVATAAAVGGLAAAAPGHVAGASEPGSDARGELTSEQAPGHAGDLDPWVSLERYSASGGGKPNGTPGERKPSGTPGNGKPSDTPGGGKPIVILRDGKPSDTPGGGPPPETPGGGPPSVIPGGSPPSDAGGGSPPTGSTPGGPPSEPPRGAPRGQRATGPVAG